MYRISNKDRDELLALLELMRECRPQGLRAENQLRRARAVLKRLQRKSPER